jgi:threonine synthase
MLGARVLEARGSFDQALQAVRELAERGSHALVNSLNPYRLEGQKTAVFEIVEELGRPPDAFAIPYGGGGNTTAYAKGLAELGLGSALVSGEAADRPATLASAIRIAEPVHAEEVAGAGATVVTVSDEEIVEAWRELAASEGVFCEPSSAAGLAAVKRGAASGLVVCTLTGHGLKDTAIAERLAPPAQAVDPDPDAIAAAALAESPQEIRP